MTDLRTLGRAMREMDRKPLPDPGTKEWDDYRKLIAAFDAALDAEPAPANIGFNVPYPHVPRYPTGVENPALAAEPAPAPDVAEWVKQLRDAAFTYRYAGKPYMAMLEDGTADLLETLARERDEALVSERNLGNLLARIHRDGGHYQRKHGTLKACVDADLIVSELFAKAAVDAALAEPVNVGFNVPYPHVPRYPTGVENPALAEPAPAPDVADLAERLRDWANVAEREGWSSTARLEREAATALETLARERDEARRLEAEAAKHVESVICLRSKHFTGEPPYVGWEGLGLALKQDYDALAAAEARVQEFESALAIFETITKTLPLGHEDQTKGASSYNWRKSCLEEIRILIKDTADE